MIKTKAIFNWKKAEEQLIPIVKQIFTLTNDDTDMLVASFELEPDVETYEILLDNDVNYVITLTAHNGLLESEAEVLKFKTPKEEKPNKPSGLVVNITLTKVE